MHVSLDSALGRQRRLNQVGESITQIAPDPAAAYSLRSLTGSDPKVVRVRRGSDNDERDFTASEVSSGALTSYVNAQVVAPLDLQGLEADGRTDAFVIAKAAYSLRSLGTRQATIPNDAAPLNEDTVVPASGKYVCQVRRNVNGDLKSFTADEVSDGTLLSFVNESFTSSLPLDVAGSAAAAYGLRDLTTGGTSVISSGDTGGDTTGKFVVQVRRSSDDTIKSFTADEVTDGTLVSFVDENINKLDIQTASGGLVGNVTNKTATGFDLSVNNEGSVGQQRLFAPSNATDGIYNVTFDVSVTSGSLSGITVTVVSDNREIVVGSNSQNFTLTSANNGGAIFFRTSSTAVANVSITNITLTQTSADGHVSTWYDQSGNSNNATQATAANQPKIVDGGALVTGGIDFTSGESLVKTGLSISSPLNTFVVSTADVNSNGAILKLATSVSQQYRTSRQLLLQYSDLQFTSSNVYTVGEQNLQSFQFVAGTSVGFFNGTQVLSGTTTGQTVTEFRLGNAGSFGLDGKINEAIIYNSDQSDKRRAIEESIATANGITLGSFNRDGFVKTWYDQSVSDQSDAGSTPTGNHATQATSGKQPKIVNAGALVTDGGLLFDGDDDFFDTGSSLSLGTEFFVTSVLNINTKVDSNGSIIGNSASGGDDRLFINTSNDKLAIRNGGVNTDSSFATSQTQDNLSTYQASSSSFTFVLNGTTDAKSALSTGQSFRYIGGGTGFNLSANMKELIIYDTDQTDNRVAIEANIGEAYSIDLPSGVDPGFDQVDGFVETWYDQSGNGNDATQSNC
jgi:hypothetical protein